MESRINYIIVGTFVILFSLGLVLFAFWLGKYTDRDEYTLYMVHMKESVAGLSTDASVKYRGVDVGTVDNIRINPGNSEEIELLLKVKKSTPVKQDMQVVLKFYGLTGLAYIEIEGGSHSSPLLEQEGDEIPMIQYSPSIYSNFTLAFTNIAAKLSDTLEMLEDLLNKQNRDNFGVALKNFKDITGEIKEYQGEIRKLVENGVVMENKIIQASNKVEEATVKMRYVFNILEESIQSGDYNIREISSHTFEKMDVLMSNLNILTREMQETVISIRNSPSDLLFKRANPKTGPGE